MVEEEAKQHVGFGDKIWVSAQDGVSVVRGGLHELVGKIDFIKRGIFNRQSAVIAFFFHTAET